jgi:hypothetical protein
VKMKCGPVQFVVAMDQMLVGWVKWSEGKPVEHVMVRVQDGKSSPKREELDDTDESLWEVRDKRPQDPWKWTAYVPMVDETGELFTYSTASAGGHKSLGELSRRYVWHRSNNPSDYPVVELGGGSYQHKDRTIGEVPFPTLKVAGWVAKAGVDSEAVTLLSEPVGLLGPTEDHGSVGPEGADPGWDSEEVPF